VLAFESLQVALVFAVATQAPLVVLQAMVLHWPPWSYAGNPQTTGVPVQTPALQASPVVHGLPSVHEVPSARGLHSHSSATQTGVVQLVHFGLPDWMHAADTRPD
jgi:hypothetical protein